MNNLEQVVLLEAIKVTGNAVPFPVTNHWAHLADEVDELVQQGLLELKDDKYEISLDGKKLLLLFKDERKEVLDSCAVYTQVVINETTVDARIALMAFRVRKMSDEEAYNVLSNFSYVVNWDYYFDNLRKIHEANVHWQQYLFRSFNKLGNINRHAWRYLGKNLQDAVLNCERLLTPLPPKKLIQIERN